MSDTGALRILVVDDNRDAADSTAILLGIWGHQVQVAYDGKEALQLQPVFQPHAVLLDIAMPWLDGNRVATLLRKTGDPTGPVLIAITGYGDVAHRSKSAEAGFDYYLVKPVVPALLQAVISGVQEMRHLTREGPLGSALPQSGPLTPETPDSGFAISP